MRRQSYAAETEDDVRELWTDLLKRNPSASEIGRVLHYVKESPLRRIVWQEFLRREPDDESLMFVLHAEDVRNEAAQLLLKRTSSPETLAEIVIHVPQFRQQAWRRLKQAPTTSALRRVADYWTQLDSATLRTEAAELLLASQPDAENLVFIMSWFPALRRQAWQYFLALPPTKADLLLVLNRAHEYADEAWQLFLRFGVTHADLNSLSNLSIGSRSLWAEALVRLEGPFAVERHRILQDLFAVCQRVYPSPPGPFVED